MLPVETRPDNRGWKPFVEFVDAFRKGQRSLVWTPTPQNPVFAVRMDSVDWYSYQVSEKAPKA